MSGMANAAGSMSGGSGNWLELINMLVRWTGNGSGNANALPAQGTQAAAPAASAPPVSGTPAIGGATMGSPAAGNAVVSGGASPVPAGVAGAGQAAGAAAGVAGAAGGIAGDAAGAAGGMASAASGAASGAGAAGAGMAGAGAAGAAGGGAGGTMTSAILKDVGTSIGATGDLISMASQYFKKWNPEKNRPLAQKIGLVSHTGNARFADGGHLFMGGGLAEGVAGQVMADFQNAFSMADTQDTQPYKDELTSYGNKPVSASSFDDLNSQKAYEPSFSHVSWQDVYGRSGGEIAGQLIGNAGKSMANGVSVAGLGNLTAGLIGMGVGISRSKKQARELNETIDETEMRRQASYENELENLQQNQFMNNMTAFAAEGGRIHIKPSKRGTFTEAAKRRGMGVQEFARTVLANKDRYSPAMVKKANFARNAARWHDDGGDLDRMPFLVDMANRSEAEFVSRLNDPFRKYIGDWASDAIATHKLGVGTDSKGRHFVFASVMPGKDGRLTDYARPPYHPFYAMERAIETGDTVRMPSFDDALLFTRKYKEYYPKGDTFEKGGTMHRFDIGGMMDGSNGQVLVDQGGSHEENKYEGVPMGMAVDGKPNLVEEGEVIYDDYVFSDRIFPTKEQLREARFPESWTKKSFAKIAEELGKESKERPNDPISKEGLDNAMRRLMNAQEKAREEKRLKDRADAMDKIKVAMDAMTPQQRQAMEEISLEQAAQQQAMARQEEEQAMRQGMGQPGMPQGGMPMMAHGGHLFYDGSSMRMHYPPSDPRYSVQFNEDYRNPFLGIGTDKDGNPAFREYGTRRERKKAKESKEYKDAQKKAREEITEEILEYRDLPDEEKEKYSDGQRAKYRILSDLYGISMDAGNETPEEGTKGKEGRKTKDGRKMKDERLRYAPAIGSGLQYLSDILGLTNNPDYENAMRIQDAANRIRDVTFKPVGNYMRYNPLDRNFYLNQLAANSAATRRSIMDNANGNQGARTAALLAADYNAQLAQGQLARQAEEYNLQQRMQAEDFNRRTNMFNSQMGLSAQAQNQGADAQRASLISQAARMRQEEDMAAAAARSANMSNFYENLGNIGRENFISNQINSNDAFLYGTNDDGTSFYKQLKDAIMADILGQTSPGTEAGTEAGMENGTEVPVKRYGGRIRKNRRKSHGK